jgi:uncharacterized MAPEG superfamily protein
MPARQKRSENECAVIEFRRRASGSRPANAHTKENDMTTPFWCLLFAVLAPYVITGVGAKFRTDQLGSLDNRHPRVQANELQGIAARAYAAQQNAWEALAVFTAAVMVAHLAGADPGASASASLVFVLARTLHAIAYIANQPVVRSTAFLTGLLCCLTLFGLAARA